MIAVSNVLLAVAIASALAGVAASLMIAGELQKRGVKINWFLFRLLLVTSYLGQYRDITIKESGRVGTLYCAYVGAMSVALVAALLGLLVRAV